LTTFNVAEYIRVQCILYLIISKGLGNYVHLRISLTTPVDSYF